MTRKILASLVLVFVVLAGCGVTTVTIKSLPEDANIWLGGSGPVLAPATFEDISAGTHAVKAHKTGYITTVEDIVYDGRSNTTFTILLRKEPEKKVNFRPAMPDKAVRVRTSPISKAATLYIYDPVTGKMGSPMSLSTTPIMGDWEKLTKLSGMSADYNKTSGLVVLRDGSLFGAATVRLGADAACGIKEVKARGMPKGFDRPKLVSKRPPEGNAVFAKNQGGKVEIGFGKDIIDSYVGALLFLGAKSGENLAWTYVDSEGRQKVRVKYAGQIKEIWSGEYGLGAFDHVKGECRVIQFLGDKLVACALTTEFGYALGVLDVASSKLLATFPIDSFPDKVWHEEYSNSYAIKCEFEDAPMLCFTFTKSGQKLVPPEIANGDFLGTDGAWLPCGPLKYELRLTPSLSVLVEEKEGKGLVLFAGPM